MALPTPTQSKSGTSTTSPLAVTMTSAITNGNLIVVFVGAKGGGGGAPNISGVTDDKGNTYVAADVQTTLFNGLWYSAARVFYCVNPTGGPTVITATVGTGPSQICVYAREYPLTSAVLDKYVAASGSGTAASSGSTGTLSQASELFLGFVNHTYNVSGASLPTSPTPANDLVNQASSPTALGLACSDATVAATTALTASYTLGSSAAWICGAITFKIPGGAKARRTSSGCSGSRAKRGRH